MSRAPIFIKPKVQAFAAVEVTSGKNDEAELRMEADFQKEKLYLGNFLVSHLNKNARNLAEPGIEEWNG